MLFSVHWLLTFIKGCFFFFLKDGFVFQELKFQLVRMCWRMCSQHPMDTITLPRWASRACLKSKGAERTFHPWPPHGWRIGLGRCCQYPHLKAFPIHHSWRVYVQASELFLDSRAVSRQNGWIILCRGSCILALSTCCPTITLIELLGSGHFLSYASNSH